MKRLRHYDKELAVVVSVFGSSEETALNQYVKLENNIRQNLKPDTEVRLAMSSRTIMKKLEQRGKHFFTLPEQLAQLDRLGYRKVVVSSINIFPTGEHEYIEQVMNSFKGISKAKYEITLPLFSRAEETNEYLQDLNSLLRNRYNASNIIFIAHGAANLTSAGNQTFSYVRDYLKLLNPRNFLYTIEGSFGYNKCFVIREIQRENRISEGNNSSLLVPLLLVAGNHYKNDIIEMQSELSEELGEVILPDDFSNEYGFSLLMLEKTTEHFINEIKYTIEKINW